MVTPETITIIASWANFSLDQKLASSGVGVGATIVGMDVGVGATVGTPPVNMMISSSIGFVGIGVRWGVGVNTLSVTTTV